MLGEHNPNDLPPIHPPKQPPPATIGELRERTTKPPSAIEANREWMDSKALEAMPDATRNAYMAALRGIFPQNEDAQTNPNDLLVSFSARDLNQPTPADAVAIPRNLDAQTNALIVRIRQIDADGKSISGMRLAVAALNAVRRAMRLPSVPSEVGEVVGNIAKARKRDADNKQSAPIRHEDIDAIRMAGDKRRWGESAEGAIKRQNLDLAMILVARDGLMRVSELVSASLDDMTHRIDGSAVLTFERAKRGGTASAYLSAETVAAVEAVHRREGDRRVIPLGKRQAQRRMAAASKAGGIVGATSHGCRVGMAQDLAEEGATSEQLKQVGSWKSDRMVQHYVREQEAPRNVVAKFYQNKRG